MLPKVSPLSEALWAPWCTGFLYGDAWMWRFVVSASTLIPTYIQCHTFLPTHMHRDTHKKVVKKIYNLLDCKIVSAVCAFIVSSLPISDVTAFPILFWCCYCSLSPCPHPSLFLLFISLCLVRSHHSTQSAVKLIKTKRNK